MHEGVLFQPDPTRLRQGRKFIAGGLQPGTLKAFQPVLRKHILAFLSRVSDSPTGVLDAIPMYVFTSLIGGSFHIPAQFTYWCCDRDLVRISCYVRNRSVREACEDRDATFYPRNYPLTEGRVPGQSSPDVGP